MISTRLREYTDEQLVVLSQAGDSDALIALIFRYRSFLKSKLVKVYAPGVQAEDLLQEITFALILAARNYLIDNGTSFRTYANTCINNKLITTISALSRKKHGPLNSYLSLDDISGSSLAMIERLPTKATMDPGDIIVDNESFENLKKLITGLLSIFERKVLGLYVIGFSYSEIASSLSSNTKAVGNALTRIRRKLRRADYLS